MVDSPTTPPDDEALPPGPRRSTYTPPPAGARYSLDTEAPGRDAAVSSAQAAPSPDVDPLAEAIAQEYRRWVPLDRHEQPVTERSTSSVPADAPSENPASAPPVSGWAPSFVTPAPDPIASPPTPGHGYRFSAPSDVPSAAPTEAQSDMPTEVPSEAPADLPSAASTASPLAGLASTQTPAPVPSPIPPPPQRQSLTDDALVAAVDPDTASTDTGTLLDLFEQQLALREQEAEQLAQWEQQVRRSAGEGADEIVARVRSAYTGVIDVIPPAPAPGDPDAHEGADSTPTAPGAVVQPAPPAPASPESAPAQPAAPNLAIADPASLTGPDLDEALAQAPPPRGIAPTVATPPWDHDDAVPPPLVAPTVSETPRPAHPLSGATELEALLAAAHAPTGDAPVPTSADAPISASAETPSRFAPPPAASEPAAQNEASPAAAASPSPAPSSSADTTQAAPTQAAPAPQSETPEREAAPASAPIVIPVTAVSHPTATSVEPSALEPTPAAQRAGRSVRLFWLWFAVSSSVVTVALGAVLLTLGMSLRQAILAALIGVALSFLPLGLGTLAGKWSGQPTMVVSRATFGTSGNVVPALLAVVTRLAWAAALLWLLATGTAEVLATAGLAGGLAPTALALVVGGVALVIAAVIAGFGFGMLALVSAIVAASSAVLVIGFIALTAGSLDLEAALTLGDGPWILLVTGAVLVLSVIGLAWAQSSGDLARYQATGTQGTSAVLFSSFGATFPAFILVSWGALLAASDPALASALVTNPVAALAGLLPSWSAIPLLLAVTLSLVSASALALYSGGFALLAVGAPAPRWVGVLATAVVTGALLTGGILAVPDLESLLRDALTTLAVPVAAWAGIVGAEIMLRSRRVHAPSLLRRGGIYPAVRWVNLSMLVVVTGVGWGFTSAATAGLQWQGYLWQILDATDPLAASDAGVLIALVLGLLTPVVAGVPALRALQADEARAAAADA